MKKKIYEAKEVKQLHDKRNQELNNAREAKRDATVNEVASWLIRRLRKSKLTYIKVKRDRVWSKTGNRCYHSDLDEYLRAHGYEIGYVTLKEKPWWSYETIRVNYYLVGYNKSDIEYVKRKDATNDW